MAATVFTWPTFSATSTSTTGRKRPQAAVVTCGAWKVGRPIHGAASTRDRSTDPFRTAAT